MPFGNVSGAGSNSNNLLVTRAQFAASWNAFEANRQLGGMVPKGE
jgi:hypothetical protein